LPVKLLYFTYEGNQNGRQVFKFKVDEASTLNNAVLEAGNGGGFQPVSAIYGPFSKNEIIIATDISSYHNYRLRLTSQTGAVSYSQEIKVGLQNPSSIYWPNPVKDKIFIKIRTVAKAKLSFVVLDASGTIVKTGKLDAGAGEQVVSLRLENLKDGVYYLKVSGASLAQSVSARFVK
jgi:hypothetical protein